MMMFKLRAIVLFALVNSACSVILTSQVVSDKTINMHRTADFLSVIIAFIVTLLPINLLAGLMADVINGVKD